MSKSDIHQATGIRSEACAWIAQLETGDLTQADIAALREWVRRSPRHAEEIRKFAQLSADANVLTHLAGPLQQAAARYQPVLRSQPQRRRIAWSWVASASTVMVVLMAVVLLRPASEPQHSWPLVLTTQVGEYLEHKLPDGSSVALNTNSQLTVEYTAERRMVNLSQGEVLFTVAKNPQQPFVVIAGDRAIEAIGTAFVVRKDSEAFEVAVTDGQVKVEDLATFVLELSGSTKNAPEQPDTNPPENTLAGRSTTTNDATAHVGTKTGGLHSGPILLRAGQRFASSPMQSAGTMGSSTTIAASAVEPITPTDLRRKLAWQEGLLDFSDTTLDSVVREVSRHTTLKIEISDPALRDLKFGGMFRTGDTEPLFKALHAAYDIQAVYINENTVQLSRAASD